MAPLCRIELLGGLRLRQADRIITRFATRKNASLLARLAYYLDTSHPREVLIEMLWPECLPEAGRNSLRVSLTSLRRQLEPPGIPQGSILQTDNFSVRLNPQAVVTDVGEFKAALRAAEREADSSQRIERLAAAVDLYKGSLLPGFYEEWVVREQEWLAELFFMGIGRLIVDLEDTGDYERAQAYARRAVDADPLSEEAHRELIRLLIESGQPMAARRQYEDLARLLREELGQEPSETTRALIKQSEGAALKRNALRHRPPLPPSFPVPTASFPAPIERFPAHLPPQFTRFFGREEEIARLQEALGVRGEALGDDAQRLTPDAQRLLTLTGPGGSGKTRLAIEAAEKMKEAFGGAVYFVPLADLRDAWLILSAIVDALRLPRSPHIEPLEQVVNFLNGLGAELSVLTPDAQRQHEEALGVRGEALGDNAPDGECGARAGGAIRQPSAPTPNAQRPMPSLLVLDNFEHLIEEGAVLVRSLLERVPTLRCLVTSRRLLDLEGEREFPVPPLPTPEWRDGVVEYGRDGKPVLQHSNTPSLLLRCPSVALFVDRAQMARPDFQVTARNAAALAALCRRLEGIPLAIELCAARALVTAPAQMLAGLERRFEFLVGRRRDQTPRHQSLWAALDWSYRLLSPELQRFFARLCVFRGGWTAEAAEVMCEEPRALDYLERLRECSLITTEEAEAGLRFGMLETLREYGWERLQERGEEAAVRERHVRYYLGLAEEAEPQMEGPEAAVWFSRLEREHDNLRAAMEWCARKAGEVETGVRLKRALYRFWQVRGYFGEARRHIAALLSHPQMQGRTKERASVLIGAGFMACVQGDYDMARELSEESLAILRESGDRQGIARALEGLGIVAWFAGEYVSARPLLEESLAIRRELGNRWGIAESLESFASLAVAQGQVERAARLWGAAASLREAIGVPVPPNEREEYDREVVFAWKALSEEAFAAALEEGHAMTMERAIEYALGEESSCG